MSSKIGNVLYATTAVISLLMNVCAFAQNNLPQVGGPLDAIKRQLTQIEGQVAKLQDTVDQLPSGDPALCDLPRPWGRKLPDNQRFVPALNGGAYCDLETGLVWTEHTIDKAMGWSYAMSACTGLQVDGRFGWHLPSLEQMLTLIDRRNSNPALPAGHPFKNVVTGTYWTSTLGVTDLIQFYSVRDAYLVDLAGGVVLVYAADPIAQPARAWCVRGGETPSPVAQVDTYGPTINDALAR